MGALAVFGLLMAAISFGFGCLTVLGLMMHPTPSTQGQGILYTLTAGVGLGLALAVIGGIGALLS